MTLSISANGAASKMLDELLRAERRPIMCLTIPRGLFFPFLSLLSAESFLGAGSGLTSVLGALLLVGCCWRDLETVGGGGNDADSSSSGIKL